MLTQVSSQSQRRPLRRSFPLVIRLDHLWLVMAPLLVALKVLLTPITPHDFWWHLAYGRAIWTTGAVPARDSFSYTRPGAPYFDQPWLAQTLMYLMHAVAGPAGIMVVQALLVAGVYALLQRCCQVSGAGRRVAVLAALLAAAATYDNWHVRPQTYVLPLWIVTLAILERWRRGGHAPWALAPLVALWSNLHGTFTLPLALGSLYLLGESWRALCKRGARRPSQLVALAGCLALAGLASFANPHGPLIWSYTFALLRNQAVGTLVTEWAPPQLGTAAGNLFFALLAGVAGALFFRRRAVTATHLVALAPFAGLALQAGRNIIWFAPLAAILVAPLWPARPRTTARREAPALNALLLALLVAPVLLALPPWKPFLGLPPRLGALLDPQTPLAAVQRLRQLPAPPRRLFHDSGFGSYLMWAAPEQPVFVDPRIEHYPLEQWQDYIKLGQAVEIERISARYGFDGYLLNSATQQPLIAALRRDPRWHETLRTEAAVLFEKAPQPSTERTTPQQDHRP